MKEVLQLAMHLSNSHGKLTFISFLQTIAVTLKEGYYTFLKSRKRKVKNLALIPLHDILGHKSRDFYFPRSCQFTVYSSLLKYSTL